MGYQYGLCRIGLPDPHIIQEPHHRIPYFSSLGVYPSKNIVIFLHAFLSVKGIKIPIYPELHLYDRD